MASVTSSTLAVEQHAFTETITMYPNPVTEFLEINFGKHSSTVATKIYDLNGKQLVSQQTKNSKQTLNLSHLANGMYVVQFHFTNSNTIKSFKIIKK